MWLGHSMGRQEGQVTLRVDTKVRSHPCVGGGSGHNLGVDTRVRSQLGGGHEGICTKMKANKCVMYDLFFIRISCP